MTITDAFKPSILYHSKVSNLLFFIQFLLSEMAHIRSFFGIEREFDRYYHLLKSQLRDGADFDDNREDDEIQIAASKTFDANKVW